MSKKAQSKSAKCQKCSLPPKPINRFLFFRTWFQSSFPSPYTLRFHQLWHVLLRTRDLPWFVIVIKWIIIVFVYIIFFNDGTCICIVSVDFKTFRFTLSFGWTSNLQLDSKVMQPILFFLSIYWHDVCQKWNHQCTSQFQSEQSLKMKVDGPRFDGSTWFLAVYFWLESRIYVIFAW